jgi:hypothetical protein
MSGGVSQIFEGYDGTVFLFNKGKLGGMRSVWHPELVLPEHQIQVLPQRLRKYPDRYNRTDQFLYRWWVLTLSRTRVNHVPLTEAKGSSAFEDFWSAASQPKQPAEPLP